MDAMNPGVRHMLLVLGIAACGAPTTPPPSRPAPAPTSRTPAPRASCAPRESPSIEELADDPGIDGHFSLGKMGPGGGGPPNQCGKTVAVLKLNAPTSSSPALESSLVQGVVAGQEDALLHCYEQFACPRAFSYLVNACFTIETNGSVAAPDADSVDPDIRACVAGVLRSLHFRGPVRGAPYEITFHLTFQPR